MKRRPISRRLMVAMFLLMLAPMSGWYLMVDVTRPQILAQMSPEGRAAVLKWQERVHRRLGFTFLISVVVMGGVVIYVRRSLVAPLADLAQRARSLGAEPWSQPESLGRADEIGDLSRALDDSVGALESRAEEAVRFAISLSHELRTPLAAIKGAAEVLADDDIGAADRARFVGNISSESERLERLVAGLLDLERSRQGRAPVMGSPCDIGLVARAVTERAEVLAARKSLSLVLDLQSGLPKAAMDEDCATRVLFGFVENALKFSPRGKTVRISVRRAAAGLVIDVADEGPGIPNALKSVIFDRAYTDGRSVGARGTGLGLAIVRSLVQARGGKVWAQDAVGGGASLVAEIPVAAEISEFEDGAG